MASISGVGVGIGVGIGTDVGVVMDSGVPLHAARTTNMRFGNSTAICLGVSMIMPWDKYSPWVKVGQSLRLPKEGR